MKKQIKFNIRQSTLSQSLEERTKYNNSDISTIVDLLILEFLENEQLRTNIINRIEEV